MRIRNSFLLALTGAAALNAVGCGGGGGGDDELEPDGGACTGTSCDEEDGAVGGDSAAEPSCSDGEQNGDEDGVDCGGDCAGCAGSGCNDGADCASDVCSADICAEPSCGDGVQNGDEEDIDCGGSCDQSCAAPCEGECAPTPGFSVATSGSGPTTANATSRASRGSARIVSTRYDWGDGTGSGTAESHTYDYAGEYVVTQTVIDADGRIATATQVVNVTGGFVPVRFSRTDILQGENFQNARALEPTIRVHGDGTVVEVRGMEKGAVRTDAAIPPMSPTAYYFEGERTTDSADSFWGFGVTTGTATLDGDLGSSNQVFGVYMRGEVTASSNTPFGLVCAGTNPADFIKVDAESNPAVGFVVDYRAANPRIHVIHRDGGVPRVRCSVTMSAVTTDLYGLFAGFRQVVGPQARINTGADTVNRPFAFTSSEVVSALAAANLAAPIAADQITFGFGRTHARAASTAPVLTAPADQSVAAGTAVTFVASASDSEEGDLTNKIEWAYRPTAYASPVRGYGASFTFTPDQPGDQEVELSVTDASGKRAIGKVTIAVSGTVAKESSIRFDEDASRGERVAVTPDGLGVYYTASGNFKDGARLNQGLIDDFWYFEATRAFVSGEFPYNMGIGLVTRDADLDPYSTYDTPWSMSVNVTAGVWRDLIDVGNVNTGIAEAESTTVQNQTRYGYAVDYRGAFPVVYVITARGNGPSGATARLIARVEMPHVHTPVYPFVYGGEGPSGSEMVPAVRLTVAPPFGFNNVAQALQTAPNDFPPVAPATSQDVAALKLGWGL